METVLAMMHHHNFFFPPRTFNQQPTLPFLRKLTAVTHVLFFNCMQNDVTTVRRCWTSFRKKTQLYSLSPNNNNHSQLNGTKSQIKRLFLNWIYFSVDKLIFPVVIWKISYKMCRKLQSKSSYVYFPCPNMLKSELKSHVSQPV